MSIVLDADFEQMLLQACASTGKTREQVLSDVKKFAEDNYSPTMRKDSLMLYLYLRNVLHVDYTIAQRRTIADVKNSPLVSYVDVEGYLVNIWAFLTSTRKNALGFTILDKTSIIDGLIFIPNVLNNWALLNFQIGDYVKLSKVNLNKWQSVVTLRPTALTTFAKVNAPYGIEETVVKLADAKVVTAAVIYAVPVWMETFTYVGCPECTVKLDVEEGMETECVGKRSCGTVVARNTELVNGIVTNGQSDLGVTFTVKIVPRLEPEFVSGGQFALMYGSYDDKMDRFIVRQVLKYGKVEIKEETKISVSSEELRKSVVDILTNWKGDLPRDVLVEYVAELTKASREQVAKVLETMQKEGLVSVG